MIKLFQKAISLFCALGLLSSLSIPAFAAATSGNANRSLIASGVLEGNADRMVVAFSNTVQANTKTVSAQVCSYTVFVDGNVTYIDDAEGYFLGLLSYQGTTYVPAEALGHWLGLNYTGRETKDTIVFQNNGKTNYYVQLPYKTKGSFYEETLTCYPIAKLNVVLNECSLFLSALEYNGILYLPLRASAEAIGQEVTWCGKTGEIFIRHPLSQEKIQTGKTFIRQSRALAADVQSLLAEFTEIFSDQKAQTQLNRLETTLTQMQSLTWPVPEFAGSYYSRFLDYLKQTSNAAQTLLSALEQGQHFIDLRESHIPKVQNAYTYLSQPNNLEGLLDMMELVLTQRAE